MGAVITLSAASRLNNDPCILGLIAYGPYCEFHPSLQGRLRVNGLPTRPLTDLALLIHRIRGVTPLSIDPSHLARLQCPVLIVHGSDDRVSPIQHARRIASGVRGATMLEIEHAAHADAHVVHEGQHDAAVQEFLRDVSGERLQA
jgi:pimeloyl-ACP methyl ester carboxylesterase